MLELLHRLGSRIRNSSSLQDQEWLWSTLEPIWERAFSAATRHKGYPTRISGDVFLLDYKIGARYDKHESEDYEPTFYRSFVSAIEPGTTVVDVGAHVGLFTLGAAQQVGPKGQVISFEPAPATINTLKRHVEFNDYTDRIEIIPAVVGNTEGEADFYVHGSSMANSISQQNVEDLNPEQVTGSPEQIRTRKTTLDTFCQSQDLYPEIIKIDVEGAELRVLRGAAGLFQRGSIEVFCEIHPTRMQNCGGALEKLRTYVKQFNYRIEPLGEPNDVGIFHARITSQGA